MDRNCLWRCGARLASSLASDEHSKAQWSYLKRGVMIEFPKYGLIHYEEPESDLKLIARA